MKKAAAIDLAFARDSSALCIVEEHGGINTVIELDEVRGGDASDPRIVIDRFIGALIAHEITAVMADCHYRKLLEVTLAEYEIRLLPEPAGAHGNTSVYLYARRVLVERRLRLPNHSLRARLVQQLRDTRGKPLSSGAMAIEHSRKDGGHGDLASALVLALWQLRDVEVAEPMNVRARMADVFQAANGTAVTRRYQRGGEPVIIEREGGRFEGFDGGRWDGFE